MAERITLEKPRIGRPLTCVCGDCAKCRARKRKREIRAGEVNRDRVCAREGCEAQFYAARADKLYCSKACTLRVAQQRYQASEKGKENQRRWQQEHPEKQREYHSRWYRSGGREVRAANKADRQKTAAQNQAWVAIVLGRLVRQPCEVCGATKVDAHHADYSKPLEVRWLCRRHHIGVHSGEVVLSQSE